MVHRIFYSVTRYNRTNKSFGGITKTSLHGVGRRGHIVGLFFSFEAVKQKHPQWPPVSCFLPRQLTLYSKGSVGSIEYAAGKKKKAEGRL